MHCVADGARLLARSWVTTIALAATACRGTAPVSGPASDSVERMRVANLHAFARLYGVVRWFHPSDAAAATDWDRLAIEGARRIIDVRDAPSRRTVLSELFAPVAPTMHMALAGEAFPAEPALKPVSTEGLDVVAWEHSGFGDSTLVSAYASKRRHRDLVAPAPGEVFASLSQAVASTAWLSEIGRAHV